MPRPYGPLGLFLSLPVLLIFTLLYFFTLLGLAAAAYGAVLGFAHLVAGVRDFGHDFGLGRLEAWLLPLFAMGVPLYLSALGAVATLALWRGGGQWRSLIGWAPWRPMRAGRAYWGLVAGGVAYGVAASVAVSLAYPGAKEWTVLPQGTIGVAVSFVLVVLAAPLTEEVLFRGWIFTSLRSRMSFWPANVATSAVFAIAHWESTHLYALAVFPLALMLGLAREEGGSTQASATFHALYNGVMLALGYLGPT